MSTTFSIIIVTYNSKDKIITCIDSLVSDFIYEIIIVDNNSDQKTVKTLKNLAQKYAYIKLVFNKKNTGFASGCNQGAEIAKGEYLIFLNPDTQTVSFDLKKLTSFFKKHKKAGVVGFKFYNFNNSLQYSFGKFPTILKIMGDRLPILNHRFGMQLRNASLYKNTQKVDWVSGSGFATRKSVFHAAGGFDENIFMYGEDIELGYRIQETGYRNYYFPKVVFRHADSGKNTPERNPHKYYSMRKGILYFFEKHSKQFDQLLFLFLVKLESLIRLAVINLWYPPKKEQKLWRKYLLLTMNL